MRLGHVDENAENVFNHVNFVRDVLVKRLNHPALTHEVVGRRNFALSSHRRNFAPVDYAVTSTSMLARIPRRVRMP